MVNTKLTSRLQVPTQYMTIIIFSNNIVWVMNNTILSTAVVCGVRHWFFLPWWAANSSIDRYSNSLPSRPSPTPPRRQITLYNVFRFIPRLPRVVKKLLAIFDRRTVHFAGDSIADFTFPAYSEITFRYSHRSAGHIAILTLHTTCIINDKLQNVSDSFFLPSFAYVRTRHVGSRLIAGRGTIFMGSSLASMTSKGLSVGCGDNCPHLY